jgi:hypothetical protein
VRRFFRVLLIAGSLATAAALAPRVASAQSARVRFDIDSIGDSTFTFAVGGAAWVTPGRRGLAVDPSNGDELIAEFRVVQVDQGVAMALVLGQTARIKAGQVAVMTPPGRPFYAQPLFWAGAGAGAVIGFFAHTR